MKIVLTLLLPVIFAGSIFSQTNDMLFVLPSCPAAIRQDNLNEPFIVNINQELDEIRIEFSQKELQNQKFIVSVINSFGSVVFNKTYSDDVIKIKTAGFTAGVYAVRIKYGDKLYVYKTIKF